MVDYISLAPPMFEFLYDIPHLVVAPVIMATFCIFGVGGMLLARRFAMRRACRCTWTTSGMFTGAMFTTAILTFYGLAVALIAVSGSLG